MHIPEPGSAVPRRGNFFTRQIGIWMLRILGWRIEGNIPNVPKAVFVAAPHTSNWDGAISLAVALAMRINLHWMGKDTMFRWPFQRLLLWMGGIPVDRKTGKGLVQTTINQLNDSKSLYILISPEGTRSSTGEWKTGFYKIAQGAKVPIVLAYIDFKRKIVGFGPLAESTGDADVEIKRIREFYRDKVARHANRFSSQD